MNLKYTYIYISLQHRTQEVNNPEFVAKQLIENGFITKQSSAPKKETSPHIHVSVEHYYIY